MNNIFKYYIRFALLALFTTLLLGSFSSFAFLYPQCYNRYLPFYQLHAMHVSAALFWIIISASACILYYSREVFPLQSDNRARIAFMCLWMFTVVIIFVFLGFRKFGGREYWEFPPFLSIPLLTGWILFLLSYFRLQKNAGRQPGYYVLMWSTGIIFFLITFIEQNLWHIPWFRESLLRDITVQWKANGSMVGAWNQMIYGTSLYLMVKISGNYRIAKSRKVLFFYFLSIINLMFNWGHHIYSLPTSNWIRHVSYAISMTEWIFFLSIVYNFKSKLEERRKLKHLFTYKFLISAEFWIYANLILALFMSIPAVNRYTHGTHITVAHAMGSTIGINTMILLAGIGYMLQIDRLNGKQKSMLIAGYYVSQVCLILFWISLIVAGLIKGYRTTVLEMNHFQEIMRPVLFVLKMFSIAGVGVLMGFVPIISIYILNTKKLAYNGNP